MFKEINQSGRSMIEMLGVLAIIGVLSVGGIAGYSKAMTKFKINKTMQQITEIATNIRTLYAQQKDFNGLNNTMAIQMGIVPDELRTSGSRIINAFGGDAYIVSNWNDEDFAIVFDNITKDGCIALATADWGTTDSTGVIGMVIGYHSAPDSYIFAYTNKDSEYDCKGSEDGYGYYACSGVNMPVSPAIASKYCGNIQSDGDNFSENFAIRFRK